MTSLLRECGSGQMLGTVATFDGSGYPGTAAGVRRVRVLVISRKRLSHRWSTATGFALAVITDLGNRLRQLGGQIRSLAVEPRGAENRPNTHQIGRDRRRGYARGVV